MTESKLLIYDDGKVEAMSYSKLFYLSYLRGTTTESKKREESLPLSSPAKFRCSGRRSKFELLGGAALRESWERNEAGVKSSL